MIPVTPFEECCITGKAKKKKKVNNALFHNLTLKYTLFTN